ncbi:hypothetical protein M8818_007817 [Zalaria obscura]|uniref:Uncharacterized protein n=1 Tax=Zalaria obscura TaxID=2024903 RepID=A0ACC3S5B5_9PEZI
MDAASHSIASTIPKFEAQDRGDGLATARHADDLVWQRQYVLNEVFKTPSQDMGTLLAQMNQHHYGASAEPRQPQHPPPLAPDVQHVMNTTPLIFSHTIAPESNTGSDHALTPGSGYPRHPSNTPLNGWDGITCPDLECGSKLGYWDVRKAATEDVSLKYETLTVRAAVAGLEGFDYCLRAGCGSGQISETGDKLMVCGECGYKQCLQCKVAWHEKESCEQYVHRSSEAKSRDEEKASERYISRFAKRSEVQA